MRYIYTVKKKKNVGWINAGIGHNDVLYFKTIKNYSAINGRNDKKKKLEVETESRKANY